MERKGGDNDKGKRTGKLTGLKRGGGIGEVPGSQKGVAAVTGV